MNNEKEGVIIIAFILLIVISPYTAILPMIYATYITLLKGINLHKNYWNMGLFSLFIWSMIVGIINRNMMSFLASFAFLVYFCFSVFLNNYCTSESIVEKIYRTLVHISIFSSILGLIEKTLYLGWGFSLWRWILELTSQQVFENRIYSTFGNPNVAGNWFGIMIILSVYFTDISVKRKKTFYSIVTILFVISVFLTGSRGAYIGILCGLGVFWFLKKNKKDILTVSLICLFAATLIIIPTNLLDFNDTMEKQTNNQVTSGENVDSGEENHEVDASVNSRLGIWLGAIRMIEDKPVTGWGMMTFLRPQHDYLGGNYYETLYHAHNIWLTFTATIGGVGLFIYLYMKFNLYKSIKLLYHKNCRMAPMLAGIQVLIIGHGVVDFTMMAPQTGIMFIGCSAIISTLSMQYSKSSIKTPALVKKYRSLSNELIKNQNIK